jgi:photosystem II stability/assembly factor-like uncharacterized protein
VVAVWVVIASLVLPPGQVSASASFGSWSTGGPFGGVVEDLAFDPTDPMVVYAATRNGVFRSVDGGVSWQRRSAGLTNLRVVAMAVNPAHPEVIWAGTNGGLFKSNDSGLDWGLAAEIESETVDIAATRPSQIFTNGYRSFDGGTTWDRFRSEQVFAATIDPHDADTVLTTTTNGVFRSVDAGDTWTKVAIGDFPSGRAGLYFHPSNTGVVYGLDQQIFWSIDGGVSFDSIPSQPGVDIWSMSLSAADPQSIYIAGRDGFDAYVARSIDGGSTWNRTAPVLGAPFIRGTESDAEHVVVGTFGRGVYTSFDGGATWSNLNDGLAAVTLTDIAVDPRDGQHLLTLDGFSIFETGDAGTTWVDRTSLVGDPARPTSEVFPTAVGIDASGTAIVARYPSVPRDMAFEPLMRSTDGVNWTQTGDLAGGSIVDQIEGDPATPGLFLAAVRDQGFPVESGQMFRSTDAGATWDPLGPTALPPVAFGRETGGDLIVQVSDQVVSKMFVSHDDGGSWTRVTQPPEITDAFVFDGSPQRIIAGSQQSSSVFLTDDGGDHWTRARVDPSNRSSNITSLAIDENDRAVVYAGTDRGGLWVSTDHGLTWAPHLQTEQRFSVDALGPTVDTGLSNDIAQPVFVGVGTGRRAGVYRLIPAPRNLRRPRLVEPSGTHVLELRRGTWKNAARFRYLWFRNGVRLQGIDGTRYRLRPSDLGQQISCRVRAKGPGGSRQVRTRAFVWS